MWLHYDSLHVWNIGGHVVLAARIKVQLRPQHRWLDSAILLPATKQSLIATKGISASVLFSQQRKPDSWLLKCFMIDQKLKAWLKVM